MAESECCVGDVSGGSESDHLDCSLDLFFEEEEGPAIAEDGSGPSDNNLPARAYQFDPYLALGDWTLMRFLRLQRVQLETKLSSTDFKTRNGKSILYFIS